MSTAKQFLKEWLPEHGPATFLDYHLEFVEDCTAAIREERDRLMEYATDLLQAYRYDAATRDEVYDDFLKRGKALLAEETAGERQGQK